jgi:hypothetical protein
MAVTGIKEQKMGNRELAVKWAAQQQAEQFFRTPSGFLRKIEFNSSEEDKAEFCYRLGHFNTITKQCFATWGDDRAISDKWYDMIVKVAEERVEVA